MKGANADLSPTDIDRAADVLKTCDLILLQLEVPLETVYTAIAFGKRHGVKTVLNPAPATAALDVDRIRDVTFFIPNETELAILTGMPVDTGFEHRDRRTKPARQRLWDRHCHARLTRRGPDDTD